MKKLRRQISPAVIGSLLCAALIVSISLWTLLKPMSDVVVIDPPPILSPYPGDSKPIVSLALAMIAAALVPVLFSFVVEKLSSRKK